VSRNNISNNYNFGCATTRTALRHTIPRHGAMEDLHSAEAFLPLLKNRDKTM
jgi:hypothetical protein